MSDEFKDFEATPVPQLVFGEAEKTLAAAQETLAGAQNIASGVEQAAQEAAATIQSSIPEAEAAAAEAAAAPAISPEALQQAVSETIATAGGGAAAVAAAAVADLNQAAPSPATVQEGLSDDVLTEQEKAQVDAFAKQIDITNSTAILQYGAGAQKKMADFSEKALENVRTKDMGEVGNMIAGLVTELQSFDGDDDKGILGFFKKNANKVGNMKARYDKAEVNVEKISKALEDHQVQLIKDIAMLDKMYELNLTYFKELTMYILAGKKRLKEVREGELAELVAKAEKTGLAEDAQAAKDLDEMCERFEKKLYDLELTRAVALQTAPQIRLVQDSDEVMVEKIQSTLVNTIPLWKNQMVIALGVEHSNQAAKAQQAVTELTNNLLKKNADTLKTATIETAKAAERGVVDIETLKQTNAQLISTLDEVVKIQSEGRAKREAAEAEMRQMELELKNKLVQMSRD